MTNVFIIDDEIQVRKWLAFCIGHMKNFQVSGESANIRDGLAQLCTVPADILILDIMMPGINGLDALEKIKSQNPGLSVIMLTNYAEFEYVQKAVHFGAEEYFLKSELTEEDLAACLERLTVKKTSRSTAPDYDLLTLQNLSVQILNHTISGKESFGEALKSCPPPHAFSHNLTVLAVRHDVSVPVSVPERNLPDISPYLSTALALPCSPGLTLLVLEMNKLRSSLSVINELASIVSWFSVHLDFHYIGISNIYYGFSDFYSAVTEAILALQYGFYKRPRSVTYVWDAKLQKLNDADISSYCKDILKQARLGDWDGIHRTLSSLFTFLKESRPLNPEDVIRSVQQLSFLLLSAQLAESYSGEFLDSLNQFSECLYLDTLCEKTEELLRKITGQNFSRSYSQPILDALAFTDEHFTENISLQDLAIQVHMNADYLGKLFKKETGRSFHSYLTEKKMEYADYLLRTTNLKKYEIADKLGYTNFSYFSRIFSAYKSHIK